MTGEGWVADVEPDRAGTVACIGAGVIGAGWAAYFLSRGLNVVAYDPAPDAGERLLSVVKAAWPALSDVGLAPGADVGRLRVVHDLADAVSAADVVQESAPENLDLKRALLRDIDAVTPPGVVICSSTSGYPMTQMADGIPGRRRLVVAHPFNPPYLIPLVEVVGGHDTDPAATAWATGFLRRLGKRVIRMDREVPGFIANRLQEALWREALHMVAAGEASVEQIDEAMVAGPGLRWAFQGPMLTFHLAGGPGGMAHMLDHFGPSLLSPWTRLAAPCLTDELREEVVAGCEREAGGRDIPALVRERDRHLVSLLRTLSDTQEERS